MLRLSVFLFFLIYLSPTHPLIFFAPSPLLSPLNLF